MNRLFLVQDVGILPSKLAISIDIGDNWVSVHSYVHTHTTAYYRNKVGTIYHAAEFDTIRIIPSENDRKPNFDTRSTMKNWTRATTTRNGVE